MIRTIILLSMLLAGVSLTDVVVAAEEKPAAQDDKLQEKQVDNPVYAHWKRFGVGSQATIKLTTTVDGRDQVTTITKKLLEVDGDKVVVEQAMVIEYNQQKIDQPLRKQVIPAKTGETEARQFVNPEGKTGEGEQVVKIKNKPFKCKWFETEMEQDGVKVKSKVWISEKMPGLVVKMESHWGGEPATQTQGEVIGHRVKK